MSGFWQFWRDVADGLTTAGTWLWDTLGPAGTLAVAVVGLVGFITAAWKWDAE